MWHLCFPSLWSNQYRAQPIPAAWIKFPLLIYFWLLLWLETLLITLLYVLDSYGSSCKCSLAMQTQHLTEALVSICVILWTDTLKLFSQRILSFCLNWKHFQHHITLHQRARETPHLEKTKKKHSFLKILVFLCEARIWCVTFKEDSHHGETNLSFLIGLFQLVL